MRRFAYCPAGGYDKKMEADLTRDSQRWRFRLSYPTQINNLGLRCAPLCYRKVLRRVTASSRSSYDTRPMGRRIELVTGGRATARFRA